MEEETILFQIFFIYITQIFALCELALSSIITTLLHFIFHLVNMNYFKSTRNSLKFEEFIVDLWRYYKLQPSDEIPEINETDLSKIMLLISAFFHFKLQEYFWCVFLDIIHSSMLITKSVASIVCNDLCDRLIVLSQEYQSLCLMVNEKIYL